MKIDYLVNSLAIVKTFFIPYGSAEDGKQLYLEARIRAITEEGFDEAGWFEVEVGYLLNKERRFLELSKQILNYKDLSERSVPSLDEAVRKLKDWCNKEKFNILEMVPLCVN